MFRLLVREIVSAGKRKKGAESSKKPEESKKEFDDGYHGGDYIYEDEDDDGGYGHPPDDEEEDETDGTISDNDSVHERESTASNASFVSAKEHLTVEEGGKRWFNKLGVKSEEAPKTIRIKSSDKNHVKVESTESEYAVINRPSRKPSKTGQKGKE